MGPILRPGVEAMAVWAEYARTHLDDPEVIAHKVRAERDHEAYLKRIAYLDACVAHGVSPVRGGELL